MIESLATSGVGPAESLSLEFAPRLNVLTGDNGLGKTFVLDLVWWALTRTWASEPAWAYPKSDQRPPTISFAYHRAPRETLTQQYRWETQTWPWSGTTEPEALVVYARLDGGFQVWDPVRNRRSAPDAAPLPPQPASFALDARQVWDGLRWNGGEQWLCNGLIRDWVSWQQRGSLDYHTLCEVLKALSPDPAEGGEQLVPGEPIRVWLNDARDHPTIQMPYGTVPVTHASAGVRRAVALAYVLTWAWHEHQRAAALANQTPAGQLVLLVDECEAHLHPTWQRRILPSLLQARACLTEHLTLQLLVTTHSPLVLASLEPLFDPAHDRLFGFSLKGAAVQLAELPWSKQGDALNWLVSDVFGLAQARSLEAERAVEAAEAWMRGEREGLSAGLDSGDAIHAELLRLLPGHDPFWPRWVVQRERTA